VSSTLLTIGAWAAAVTAVIMALKHLWGVFVAAVRAAVSEEIGKFHKELDSVDQFWTERIDRLEKSVQTLEERSRSLYEMVTNGIAGMKDGGNG